MFLQPAFYALRPVVVLPKEPRQLEAVNWAAQLAFDYAIYATCGWQGVAYLIASTLLGMGMHPMAGHFVAEHYTFINVRARREAARSSIVDIFLPFLFLDRLHILSITPVLFILLAFAGPGNVQLLRPAELVQL